MLSKTIGQSQQRIAFSEFLTRIIKPINKALLRINRLRKIVLRFRVGKFNFSFRPFIYSDLLILFTDFEPYVKHVFKPRKGDIVFDIGAHLGLYTLAAANSVGREGMVVAFEPDDENFHLLQRNVRLNGFENVKLVKAALGKEECEKLFCCNIDPMNSSLVWTFDVRSTRKIQVMTLDEVVENSKLHHIDWIKIDVEGGEMDVLEGGKKAFTYLVDNVIIETNDEKALRFLKRRKFRIERLFTLYTSYYFCVKDTSMSS